MLASSSADDFAAAMSSELFPPAPAAADARLKAVRPHDYARTRNALDGAVTGLSPYITHGLLPLHAVVSTLRARHGLQLRDKLMQELGWRAYFHHVWRHLGDGIFASLHQGPLPDAVYSRELPRDIVSGATGVPVIDQAVRALYRDGYLHNHARMWLASYVVNLRKIHWRAGADWMYAHLLDGDLASNHLSWQWIAGTASRKPYLFNAENVARLAPPSWHGEGSVIDADYATLDRLARTPGFIANTAGSHSAVAVPTTLHAPPACANVHAPEPAAVDGCDVWLVHPWSLADPPSGTLPVAVFDLDFHQRWLWSELRWRWVVQRMQAITSVCWIASGRELVAALAAAHSVCGWADPHLPWLASALGLPCPPRPFVEPVRHCQSFSAWFSRLSGFADAGVPEQQDLF